MWHDAWGVLRRLPEMIKAGANMFTGFLNETPFPAGAKTSSQERLCCSQAPWKEERPDSAAIVPDIGADAARTRPSPRAYPETSTDSSYVASIRMPGSSTLRQRQPSPPPESHHQRPEQLYEPVRQDCRDGGRPGKCACRDRYAKADITDRGCERHSPAIFVPLSAREPPNEKADGQQDHHAKDADEPDLQQPCKLGR